MEELKIIVVMLYSRYSVHILGGIRNAGYTGDIFDIMHNLSKKWLYITITESFAQLTCIFTCISTLTLNVTLLEQKTERGDQGFSSGQITEDKVPPINITQQPFSAKLQCNKELTIPKTDVEPLNRHPIMAINIPNKKHTN
ncbi:hypothetical protein CHUAL_010753 [Chamberlinius hualienensis]